MTPLLIRAQSKHLRTSDCHHPSISSTTHADTMHSSLLSLPLDIRLTRPGDAFSLAVWHVTGRRYLVCGVLRLFNDFFMILGPFCLRGLILYMTPV